MTVTVDGLGRDWVGTGSGLGRDWVGQLMSEIKARKIPLIAWISGMIL